MRLAESSSTEISGSSEVPQFAVKLFFQKVQLLGFCPKIVSVNVNQNM